jgi:DNA-binding NarL/FixJ family response regulator
MAPPDHPKFPMSLLVWTSIADKLKLPPQQQHIVELILCNYCDKQIAADMKLKVPTIREYVRRIHSRLGVHDRQELILRIFAMSQGIDPQ